MVEGNRLYAYRTVAGSFWSNAAGVVTTLIDEWNHVDELD
jgi:hypothetical protein